MRRCGIARCRNSLNIFHTIAAALTLVTTLNDLDCSFNFSFVVLGRVVRLTFFPLIEPSLTFSKVTASALLAYPEHHFTIPTILHSATTQCFVCTTKMVHARRREVCRNKNSGDVFDHHEVPLFQLRVRSPEFPKAVRSGSRPGSNIILPKPKN